MNRIKAEASKAIEGVGAEGITNYVREEVKLTDDGSPFANI
jgi:hypothetical protein